MEIIILASSFVVSLVVAIFALWQARAAKVQAGAAKIQADASRLSLEQTSRIRLFSTFDLASQVTIERPELLMSVHGLSNSVSIDEARCIAYFSLLLDAFEHFYGEKYDCDFDKMKADIITESNFLNRLLLVPANHKRWEYLKTLYFGDFDSGFVKAIEDLIEYQKRKKG